MGRNRIAISADAFHHGAVTIEGGILMNSYPRVAAVLAAALFAASAAAQTGPSFTPANAGCELHVWPTQNYLGVNSGLLSGLGPLGALADMEAHKGKVATVKDLMGEYLGPDVQLAELNRIDVANALKLQGYRVIVEEPTPFNEDVKKDPALKAKTKLMNDRIKANQRLSASTNPCYAELITTHIFYHKAMMYGSNLFTGWIYREFDGRPVATKVAKGQVKNPLEHFPPATPDKVEVAKLELRDAYAKDFSEYVQKKVAP